MVAKQLADLITIARGLLAIVFPWMGLTQGTASLPWAGVLIAADWTGDVLDGALARRSGVKQQTWVGAHDLEIDMLVSLGLLIYMTINGWLSLTIAVVYLLLWGAFFLRAGIPRSMGMLFQAPIYGWFIYIALLHASTIGWMLVAWVLAAVVITWPRFPQEVIPGFLRGMGDFLHNDQAQDA
jgi:hypothetical protein